MMKWLRAVGSRTRWSNGGAARARWCGLGGGFVGALAVIVGISGCAGHGLRSSDSLPTVGEVGYMSPSPERWTTSNGVDVLFLPDDEIPMVRGTLMVRAGGLWEASDQVGSSAALAHLMRSGGAGGRSADELDRDLEKLSAAIGAASGAESFTFSFNCLSADFETVLGILSDVVLRPRFEESRLNLWKGQSLEAVRRRTDEPNTVAGLALGELLYGWGPYGRYPLESDVRSVSRAMLRDLHREMIVPDGAILAVTGAASRQHVEELLERYLGGWFATGRAPRVPPPVEHEPRPAIYHVALPVVQSTIYIGQLGVPRLTEDYIAIEGFNELFGASGFGSMLMQKIRTELGLAYSLFGAILPGPVKGRNIIAVQTKAESAGTALVETLKVLQQVRTTEVPPEKLVEAKRSIANSFIFRFDDVDELLNRRALQTYLDYPVDYDTTYLPRVAALTPADIRQVGMRRWDPARLVIVVVGDRKAYAAVEAALKSGAPELAGYSIQSLTFNGRLQGPAVIDGKSGA